MWVYKKAPELIVDTSRCISLSVKYNSIFTFYFCNSSILRLNLKAYINMINNTNRDQILFDANREP